MPKYPMAPGEEMEDKTEAESSIIYRDREEAKMRHSRKYRDYRATTYDLGENIHFNFLWPLARYFQLPVLPSLVRS